MTNFRVMGLASMMFIGSLAGCGGSSSGSDEEPSRNPTKDEQPQTDSLSVPNYVPQIISEESAESVAKSVYRHLRYIAWDAIPNSDRVTGTFSPEQLVREFTDTDTFDLSDFLCSDSGTYQIKALEGYPEIDAEENLFFGPGDKLAFIFDGCAGEGFTLPDSTREGTATVDVIDGYIGLFGDSASSYSVTRSVSNKNGFVADGQLVGYTHGDIQIAREPGQLTFSGNSYKRNPSNNLFLEYFLGTYSLTFEEIESATSYDRWNVSSDFEFQFGIKALGGHFRTTINDVIFTDNELESGVITLADDHNSLRIELFPSHLTFELDLDGDGIYEIERMLNRGEF